MHFWTLILDSTQDFVGNATHSNLTSVSFPGWITVKTWWLKFALFMQHGCWFQHHQYWNQSFPTNHTCGKVFQRHRKELKAIFHWFEQNWGAKLFALIWKEMEEYFTSVTAELEIKYYKQSRDVGNLEFIWSTYSVWPDQLQHLHNRREENGVFNKVQVLQVQCREFENHVVQQIWKTGSPNSGNCIAWFVLNPLWYESLPLDFTVFPGWKTLKCMLSLISKGSDA